MRRVRNSTPHCHCVRGDAGSGRRLLSAPTALQNSHAILTREPTGIGVRETNRTPFSDRSSVVPDPWCGPGGGIQKVTGMFRIAMIDAVSPVHAGTDRRESHRP